MKKIAVIFPGTGYHSDKPLLYYSRKLAAENGYEVKDLPYGNFLMDIKDNVEKKKEAFNTAYTQAENMLKEVQWDEYEEILFISKSIGTLVSAAYAKKYDLVTRNVFFTPVAETFQFVTQPGIVFHGTYDPWAKTEIIREKCRQLELPLYAYEGANHSMETGNVMTDIENLTKMMEQTKKYIIQNGDVK